MRCRQVALTVVLCVTSLVTTLAAAKLLNYDTGTAAGLMAGAFTESTVIGTATHGRIKTLKEPVCAFVRTAAPIPFEAPDGAPVNLVFAMLVPEHATEAHLELLSELAQMFSDAHLRDAARDDRGHPGGPPADHRMVALCPGSAFSGCLTTAASASASRGPRARAGARARVHRRDAAQARRGPDRAPEPHPPAAGAGDGPARNRLPRAPRARVREQTAAHIVGGETVR